jgi:hypothetical protein
MGNEQGIDVNQALKAIEEADKAPAVEKVEVPEDILCPRCGFNDTQEKVTLNEEDQEEFYRCMMGMRPYAKKFQLWKGDLNILLSTLDSKESDTINRKLRSVRSDDQNEILELSIKLKLLFMIREVTTTEKQFQYAPPEDVDDMDVNAVFEERFALPEPVLRVMSRVFTEFEILVDALTAEGFDENFYKGGGAA